MNLHFNGEQNVFQFDPTLAIYVQRDRLDPIVPSYSSPLNVAPQIDVIRFGGNYAQVQPKGVNNIVRKFGLVFSNRPMVIIEALRRFFDGEGEGSIYGRNISEYFYYAPPSPFGSKDGLPLKWMMLEGYDINPNQYNSWTFNVKIEQWFQP